MTIDHRQNGEPYCAKAEQAILIAGRAEASALQAVNHSLSLHDQLGQIARTLAQLEAQVRRVMTRVRDASQDASEAMEKAEELENTQVRQLKTERNEAIRNQRRWFWFFVTSMSTLAIGVVVAIVLHVLRIGP
jgi:hypothetical protein